MTLAAILLAAIALAWLLTLTFLFLKLNQKKIETSPVSLPQNIHFGLVKFSPFTDTGGDQSFVISLLNGGGDGILITSLHARGVTRLYAKKVLSGKTEQSLSVEEKQALKDALET